MKINLAKSAGFCFGVKNALTTALKTAQNKQPVVMLGDIVHNENVVKQIQNSGIKKISRLTNGKGKTLLIRAHGCSKKTLQLAKKLEYRIVDATCPMVKEIHKIACKLEKEGYQIIVIGDRYHDEVKGIVGQLKAKTIIIDKLENIPLAKIKKLKKAAVVLQSTQNLDKVLPIIAILKQHIQTIKFHNTICNPTKTKQNEVKTMPLENDLMIIIGSRNSANTKRIFEIAKSLNKNSYWINSDQQIKKSWLANALNVGITAGASTPQTTINKVIQKIKLISGL
ncbi:MAG: 4-hydroxy-3-methylbut-2-enyl diphosphate reductase [Candidatus Omnitrophota bacterium]